MASIGPRISVQAIYWWLFFSLGGIVAVLMPSLSIPTQAALYLPFCLFVLSIGEGRGLLHPFSWFPAFYFLYSVSYPLYSYTMQVGDEYSAGLVIPVSFFGFMAFTLALSLFARRGLPLPKLQLSKSVLFNMLLALCLISALLLVFVGRSGVQSKREFLDYSSTAGIGNLFVVFHMLALVYALYLIERYQRTPDLALRKAVFNEVGIAVGVLLLIAFGLTGERDYLFRAVLFASIVVFSWRYRFRYKYLVVGVASLVLVLPLSQAAKAFLLTESINYSGYQQGDVYRTEFASAGRNLAYLVEHGLQGMGGETFVWDVERYLGVEGRMGTGAWFNNHVRALYGDAGTSGWGFSLVAEGYLNFGVKGVVGLFFIIGAVTSFLYRLSTRSTTFFAFYLAYIPVMIYVLRADVANFLSLAFKVNVGMVLVLSITSWMHETLKRRHTRSSL